MFGANTFGTPYFSQVYSGIVGGEVPAPRVGGTPSGGADRYRARIKVERPPEVDLYALGQALGVIDP